MAAVRWGDVGQKQPREWSIALKPGRSIRARRKMLLLAAAVSLRCGRGGLRKGSEVRFLIPAFSRVTVARRERSQGPYTPFGPLSLRQSFGDRAVSLETISGTFDRIVWSPADGESLFRIAVLQDGTSLKGNIDSNDPPVAGHRYSFSGFWEKEGFNGRPPAFRFRSYVECEPLSRTEVVAYLARKLKDCGISYGIASRIYDAFGEKAIETLRNSPAEVAAHSFVKRYLKPEQANNAATLLLKMRATSEVEAKLMGLFDKKHFPHGIVKDCVKRFGIRAAARVKHDPYVLLVAGLAGCGFKRCDTLYQELGCNPHRLKRQAICLWNAVCELSERSGDTWIRSAAVVEILKQRIGGTRVRPERAMKLATHPKVGMLTLRRDAAGVWWIAETAKARQGRALAAKIHEILSWVPPAEIDVAAIGETGMQRFEVTDAMIDDFLRESGDPEAEIAGLIREGQETGVCQFCGRELTNEESRGRGYGPVCAAKWNLPYGEECDGNAVHAGSNPDATEATRPNAGRDSPSVRRDPAGMVG